MELLDKLGDRSAQIMLDAGVDPKNFQRALIEMLDVREAPDHKLSSEEYITYVTKTFEICKRNGLTDVQAGLFLANSIEAMTVVKIENGTYEI